MPGPGIIDFINDTKEYQYALDGDRRITQDPTGFVAGCIVTGNGDRTVTLSGTVEAYWRGSRITSLVSGWTSPAHGNDTAKVYYLYSSSNTAPTWGETLWEFSYLQVTYAFYDATLGWVYQHETHGFMPHDSHENDHFTIGSWRQSGGDLSNYVLSSTTATDRRPYVSQMIHHDEDLETTQAAISTNSYTIANLTGTGTAAFTAAQTDIVPLSVANPYYNSYSAPNWGQTLMPANSVMSIWLVSIPMAADANSQTLRFVWGQGQWITRSTGSGAPQLAIALEAEKLRTFGEMNLGNLASLSPEFLPIARVIITYTSGNWYISYVENLTGSRFQQTGSQSGNFLSTVTTDTTLTGDGAVASPLSVVQNYVTLTGNQSIDGVKTFTDDISIGADSKYLKLGAGSDAQIGVESDNLIIQNVTSNKDIIFKVNDGGVEKDVLNIEASGPQFQIKNITTVSITNDGAANMQFNRYSDNTAASFFFGRKARGTEASPSQTLNNDSLFTIVGRGHTGSAFLVNNSVSIQFFADEDITAAAAGGYFLLSTIGRGTLFAQQRLKIDSDGDVIFNVGNTDSDFTINKNTAGTAYVYDAGAGTHTFSGDIFSDSDLTFSTTKGIVFRDAALHIRSDDDGYLDITADEEIDLNATDVLCSNNLGVVNDLTVSAELKGARQILDAATSADLVTAGAATTLYLRLPGNITMNANLGYPMSRPGSIVGAAFSMYCDALTTPGDIICEVRKNGAVVYSFNITVSAASVYTDSATQARGTDTFSANDIIQMSMTSDGTFAGTITWALATVDIQVDT